MLERVKHVAGACVKWTTYVWLERSYHRTLSVFVFYERIPIHSLLVLCRVPGSSGTVMFGSAISIILVSIGLLVAYFSLHFTSSRLQFSQGRIWGGGGGGL